MRLLLGYIRLVAGCVLSCACVCLGVVTVVAQDYGDEDAYKQVDLVFCNNGEITESLAVAAQAGEQQELCYDLINRSNLYTWVNVRFVDASPRGDGQLLSCADDAAPQQFFANYVEPDTDHVFLKPGQVVRKHAFVTFPASTNGMRYACIAIQRDVPEEERGKVNVVVRSIYKIKAQISGSTDTAPQLPAGYRLVKRSGPIRILYDGDQHILAELDFSNTTNLNTDVTVQIAATGVGYEYHDERKATLTPGEHRTVSIELPRLPWYLGWYRFSFDSTEYILGSPVVSTQTFSVMLWSYTVVCGILGVILPILFFAYKSVIRRRQLARTRTLHVVGSGDTIITVAHLYRCRWQDIVRANQLVEPYLLEPGRQIVVFDYRG